MKIETIKLFHFRNYDTLTLYPHSGINLFFGQNGTGKTNLLEAIHYCALGKSHRINHDQSIVRHGEISGFCRVELKKESGLRNITVQFNPSEAQKKTILIDQKKIGRFSELMGCLQCVIFSPEDLGLIREGPSIRRKYLDMMISQMNRGYFIALQQYRTGLEQRNAVLKTIRLQGSGEAWLEDFEHVISKPAAVIVEERRKIVSFLADLAREIYGGISGREKEIFNIQYKSSLSRSDNIEEDFLKMMRENREQDIHQAQTTAGPHRDDLNLSLNQQDMRIYASQGQVRTAALSMKMAQLKTLYKISGEKPVLLLDDVMSELDRTRRTSLLKEIESFQTFVTCTDESDLEENCEKRVYHVSAEHGIGQVVMSNSGNMEMKEAFQEPCFT